MALRKDLRNSRGMTGSYHRIEQVIKNYDEISVVLKTYADESYREKEKTFLDLSKRLNDLNAERLQLVMDADKNVERLLEINEEFDKFNELSQVGDFGIFTTQVLIPCDFENEISFSEIYRYLSEEDETFKGAVIA